MDTDITGANPGAAGRMWERLEHNLSTEGKQQMQAFRARQSDKKQALAHAKKPRHDLLDIYLSYSLD